MNETRTEHVLNPTVYVWCRRLAAQFGCGSCPGKGLIPLSVCQGYGVATPCEHYRYDTDSSEPHRCNFGDMRRSDVWHQDDTPS